jgi:hypothetical protein
MLARATRGAGVLRVVGQAEEAEGRAQRQREAAGAAEQQLHQLKMQVHRPAACRILSIVMINSDLESQVSKFANRDACPRPTTSLLAGAPQGGGVLAGLSTRRAVQNVSELGATKTELAEKAQRLAGMDKGRAAILH